MDEKCVLVFKISTAQNCRLVELIEALTAEANSLILDSGLGAQPEQMKTKNTAVKSSAIALFKNRHIFLF